MALGKIIYNNSADKAVEYFERIEYPCPEMTNPADFFMTIMSIEAAEEEAEFENSN
jgi:ATP-binding cassette subfamily G (WHITE) protein 8 (sterolin 2)